MITENIVW